MTPKEIEFPSSDTEVTKKKLFVHIANETHTVHTHTQTNTAINQSQQHTEHGSSVFDRHRYV